MAEFRRFRALSDQARRRATCTSWPPPRRARRSTVPISSTAPRRSLKTEIRVLSGRAGSALFGAWRHLRLPSGRWHRRRPRRRQPRAGRRQGRSDRRRHNAAARRPAPAGHGEELASPRRRRSRATNWRGPKLLKGGQGRPFYAVGGTWRNLARLHMEMTNYPLGVMHHYEIGAESAANFLKQVAQSRDREGQGHRRRLEEPPLAAALWRHRAAGDHDGDAAVEDHRLGARRARRLSLFAARRGRAEGRSADLGGRGTRPAALALVHPRA